MLFQDHWLGLDERVAVGPADPALEGAPIMRLTAVSDDDATALFTRLDVERLRDLCEEALA